MRNLDLLASEQTRIHRPTAGAEHREGGAQDSDLNCVDAVPQSKSRMIAARPAVMERRFTLLRNETRRAAWNPSDEGIGSCHKEAFHLVIDVVFRDKEVAMSRSREVESIKNVVLVHGGFVDGSGWRGVYDLLKKDGYEVTVVQNPTSSLADDVEVTKRALAAQDGPAILVGHSYGGVVITEAGNDPKVAGLVYIAAFAPDKSESVSALIQNPPPGAPVPPILPPQEGYLFLDRTKFRASFAADVSPDEAAFMADSQVPWGLEALNGAVSAPAWRTKPSWYLVATDDKMIPPDAQRAMSKRAGSTVAEVAGSHAVYVSQPTAVAAVIAKAATGVVLAKS